MTMNCPACGTENRPTAKFCVECGTALALACPSCGAPHTAGQRFCAECGTALTAAAPQPPSTPREAPAAERRLVTVLFADLVGFTAASERRDAEETRELLSRYFDLARMLIGRYGGQVEKFIGDAVMAVWGTPIATEDDAERAVRAALDLVAGVAELDPALRARAGVITGEAAVTLGAEGQGMVAGDLVNTASRVQSAAEPGTVLVGDSTRRASEQAIGYEPAGTHELKGKAEPIEVFRALRVLSGRRGDQKSTGLEPPFVGRERELRLVKELFHASTDERKAHLVTVSGIGGIGKSRLAWEFFKYIDGLADTVWWWRGRCLAYGEGVAYWALAEMIRTRADIVEGEDPAAARAKLAGALEPYIADLEERGWIEPRLAHLLGLEEGGSYERDDLFGAWRLYFERFSEHQPAVLVFEDMQWADASLLDFVDYLLEWARKHAIFVLALARPELAERHPDFGKSSRNTTTLSLEPLAPEAMEALIDGFVPGLPESLRTQILERAEGVPLYAVETVRMLLDRGLVVREGAVYRPTGEVETLDVPETLQSLISARLDSLAPEERRVVHNASVLGKTFTREAVSALSGRPSSELDPLLASLVRKEILFVQANPRSPERGQYGFLQDLVRRVAYETLSRNERKGLHLAAAAQLEQAFGSAEQEIVEVVAAHYVAAYEAIPDADDAAEIRARAVELVARAGERAASLSANEEAQRYFDHAADLAEEPVRRAELLELAGHAARVGGRFDAAAQRYETAIATFTAEGLTHPAARVSARLGDVDVALGRLDAGLERMEAAYAVLESDPPDADLAALAAQLARFHMLAGNPELAVTRVEAALETAEALRLPAIIADALNTKGTVLRGRPEESIALVRHALEVALEHDIASAALRAYNNLGFLLETLDRYEEEVTFVEPGIELARRVGDRGWEWNLSAGRIGPYVSLGRWNEALEFAAELEREGAESTIIAQEVSTLTYVHAARGDLEAAEALLAESERAQSSQAQGRLLVAVLRALLLRVRGKPREALGTAEEALAAPDNPGPTHPAMKAAYTEALEAALMLRDAKKMRELLEALSSLTPAQQTPSIGAQIERYRAHLAAATGSGPPEQGFKLAAATFREIPMPYWLAVTLAEHGEWLVGQRRSAEAEPLLTEAREIFERLEATPWLERLAAGMQADAVPA